MTVSSKPPTPQGISALLRKAGFGRSDYGRQGVMWKEASPGYSVWRTYHHEHPDQPYVAVQHVVKGVRPGLGDEEDWSAYVKEARSWLEKYAEVIREAGYAPVVRDRGTEPPWLTILTVVTAGKEGQ